MSEQVLCVCGHTEDSHKLVARKRDGQILYRGHCQQWEKCHCHRYKQVVDWPNEEGWWAMERPYSGRRWQPVFAYRDGDKFILSMIGLPMTIDNPKSSLVLNKDRKPARFTKLLEPNPFGDSR